MMLAWDWERSLINQYLEIIFCWIGIIIICIILFIELYNFICVNSTKKELSIKVYTFIPIFIYTFYILFLLSILIHFHKWSDNCMIFGLSGLLSYAFAKFMLYQYYLARLYSIYSSSAFQFNTKIVILSSIILITYNAVTTVLVLLSYKVIHIQQQIIYNCLLILPLYIIGFGYLIDGIISCVCLYLFTKPIVYLVNSTKESINKDVNDTKLYGVLVKIYTLSTVQFITTLISGIMLIFSFGKPPWLADAAINSICIALMNKEYTKTYNKLCCCINKICGKCVITCCVKMKKHPQLSLKIVATNSGQTSTPKHILPIIDTETDGNITNTQ